MHPLNPFIRKVVMVDDDMDDFLLFEEALKRVDPTIKVRYLSSINDIPEKGSYTLPDLMFLDINMPDKNGFDWLNLMRRNGYSIPVIIYSTASNPAYVEKAYKEGANVYMPKPESFNTLQQALASLLQLNWLEPEAIKETMCSNGQFSVFTAN